MDTIHLQRNLSFATSFPSTTTGDTLGCALAASGGRITTKSVNHTGNGATTDNIFQVTGQIRLLQIYGVVTAIGGGGVGTDDTIDSLKLEVDDGTNQVDMTLADSDLTGNGTVGTVIIKEANAATKMTVLQADECRYDESATNRVFNEGVIIQKASTATYIRASYTGDANTDLTIQWIIRWQPMVGTTSTVTAV